MMWLDPDWARMKVQELGFPAFRGDQVAGWLYKGASCADEMKNLPRELSAVLELDVPETVRRQQSPDGTVKVLLRMRDGAMVETVVMRYRYGASVCVSSQVGCRMGCRFCASTMDGLVRNLTSGEMMAQVVYASREAGVRPGRIVLMGMGEPLDNLDNVLEFIRLCGHPKGLHMSARHITVSTCGLPNGMEALADSGLPVTLSVSLHAPDDPTRTRLMPVNRSVGVQTLLSNCHQFFAKTGRRISMEYVMIEGVNDSEDQARLLGERLRGSGCHVNLIRYNRNDGLPWQASGRIRAFQQTVQSYGVSVTVRRGLGGEIEAACGQLRKRAGGGDERVGPE